MPFPGEAGDRLPGLRQNLLHAQVPPNPHEHPHGQRLPLLKMREDVQQHPEREAALDADSLSSLLRMPGLRAAIPPQSRRQDASQAGASDSRQRRPHQASRIEYESRYAEGSSNV